jgi:hypothetical protein
MLIFHAIFQLPGQQYYYDSMAGTGKADFQGTDKWVERSLTIALVQHLQAV